MFKSHLYSVANATGKPTRLARLAALCGVIRRPSTLVAAVKDQRSANAKRCKRTLQQSVANALSGCV